MEKFSELPLSPVILKNLEEAGYSTPTPIQREAIPFLLAGNDLLGIAQTGTGKTAAFSLPIINYLVNNPKEQKTKQPRVLILSPTRELSSQIKTNIIKYSRGLLVKTTVIFGGVGQTPQVELLRNGVDILVATPGRLLDLMNQGHLSLDRIEVFVLDEADRMLDMGFIHDIRKVIAKLPKERQTLLFSATMPDEIAKLSASLLKNPKRVEVTPPSTTVERIDQKVIFCQRTHKYQLLRKVLAQEGVDLTLVFTRTKHGANKIVEYLAHHQISSAAIHGNKSQSARESALANFKSGKIKVLIATDIAARGIDIDGVSHVVNFDLPIEAESYVHRIGRTARAGRDGDAISFCDETERDALSRIQRLIGLKLPVETFVGEQEAKVPKQDRPPRPQRPQRPERQESRNARPERYPQRDDRPQRNERPQQRNDRSQRDERPQQRNDRPQRDERPQQRTDRPQRDGRPQRNDRPHRNERPGRQDRAQRPDRDQDNFGNRSASHRAKNDRIEEEDDFQPGHIPTPEEQMKQMESRIDKSKEKKPKIGFKFWRKK